jgi:hypothetical protein
MHYGEPIAADRAVLLAGLTCLALEPPGVMPELDGLALRYRLETHCA